jgi:hypothetical protein
MRIGAHVLVPRSDLTFLRLHDKSVDVHIFTPINMQRGNWTLFYTVVDRGRASAPWFSRCRSG